MGGGRSPYPLFCPSSAKGGSPWCPVDSQPPQPWKPLLYLKRVGRGSKGLPQPLEQGPFSPSGPEGCSPFQSESSRWQTPVHFSRSLLHPKGRLPRNLELATRNSPKRSPPKPPFHPRNPPQKHTPACAPPRISAAPTPTRRRAPRPVPTDTHTLRFQPPGLRRSRSEYLVRQCSEAQIGRARYPTGAAECFSSHPQWWLLFFPVAGGRRGEGGEGESEEPRGCKSRAGTTSAGPTLGPAQSTPALLIGQT